MREELRFLLGHETRTLRLVDPTMTVLDYLRQVERLVGTKEGCNEGDCGACTVVVARPEGGGLRYEAVNACIQFLATLDGCQLLTVEHLAEDGALHPVQRALVDCHGSQCGFCTPGIVMSLFALTRHSESAPEEERVDAVLAGNLCRCTGYAPLVRAAQRMYELAPRDDAFAKREEETLAKLAALRDEETLAVSDGDGRRFFAPASLDALAELCEAHPQATIVAGSTDVGLWVTKDMRRLESVIYIGRVAELSRLADGPEGIEIGAGVTYSEAMATLARHYPDMGEVLRRLGSVQIRNAGTIGGNIANGSPIGDSPPLLIAVGASLHLRKGSERRALPLEDYFIDYGKQDRRPGEFVEKIVVPRPASGTQFRAYKIAKRYDQDISAVLGAMRIGLDGDKVADACIAFGGLAATPKRARAAEGVLIGAPWSEASVEQAMAALDADFTPITDWRASAGYRRQAGRNLLLRCYIETTDRATETRVLGDRDLAHV